VAISTPPSNRSRLDDVYVRRGDQPGRGSTINLAPRTVLAEFVGTPKVPTALI
jgi:hypothetical protein